MKLIDCNLDRFLEIIRGKEMVWFGASKMPQEICNEYPECHFEKKIKYFVDNSRDKQEEGYWLCGKKFSVASPEYLSQNFMQNMLLVITSRYYADIWNQLQTFKSLENAESVIWPMAVPQYKTDICLKEKIKSFSRKENIIPKKIHYFWFGGNPLPELETKCIESWKKHCPEYEIIRWDESNYDINKNEYMRQAYEAKKWGFVPDYARLDVVYTYGGIYLDTDVEVVKNFDELLYLSGFAGFESKKFVNFGQGFGAIEGNIMLKDLMEDYKDKKFYLPNNQFDLTPSPAYQTAVLKKFGLEMNNKLQKIKDMVILPCECFSPDNNMIPHITENTFSIHHFSGSWTTGDNKLFLDQQRNFAQKSAERV